MSNSIKLKKFHFIYKTTNLLNNMFYIGMHSTSNLKDGYIGSGTRLRHSIRKYGKENFKCEILEFLPDRNSLKEREKQIINEKFLNNDNCYNLKLGGEGGFNNQEHQIKCSNAGNKAFKEKLKTDSKLKEKYIQIGKNLSILTKEKGTHRYGDWTGKKHKESTKKLIGEKNSINQKGENNSQYGTYWVNKQNINKKIKSIELDSYLKNGWVRGVKSNINGELVKNSKLTNDDVIKIKQQLFYDNLSNSEIAKQFNVAPQTINKIKKGITWIHITIY